MDPVDATIDTPAEDLDKGVAAALLARSYLQRFAASTCVHDWRARLEFIDDEEWAELCPTEPAPPHSVTILRCERCDEIKLLRARAEDTGPSPLIAPGVGDSLGAQTLDALTHASDTETPDIQGETRIGRAEAE